MAENYLTVGHLKVKITVSNVDLDDLQLDAGLQNGGQDITDSAIDLSNVTDANLVCNQIMFLV